MAGVKTRPRRGDVYWVALDPTLGSEIRKTRPAVIVSNDSCNAYGSRVVVLPLTSNTSSVYPGEALVHTANAALLTTEKLSTATDRADFKVKEVHCFLGTCRVLFERTGAAADSGWTYDLVDALAAARIPGIDSVEPNPVTHR